MRMPSPHSMLVIEECPTNAPPNAGGPAGLVQADHGLVSERQAVRRSGASSIAFSSSRTASRTCSVVMARLTA